MQSRRIESIVSSNYCSTRIGIGVLFQHPQFLQIVRSTARPGGYWLGGVWAPMSYMVVRGLNVVGRRDLAKRTAHRLFNNVDRVFRETVTLWENYAPNHRELGDHGKLDFYGWTALIFVAMWREYLA